MPDAPSPKPINSDSGWTEVARVTVAALNGATQNVKFALPCGADTCRGFAVAVIQLDANDQPLASPTGSYDATPSALVPVAPNGPDALVTFTGASTVTAGEGTVFSDLPTKWTRYSLALDGNTLNGTAVLVAIAPLY